MRGRRLRFGLQGNPQCHSEGGSLSTAAQAPPGGLAYRLAKGVLAVRCLAGRSTQGGKMANYELDGRTAIVTGAGAGIGEACARVLSTSGAAVLVVDLDEERTESVAKSISNDGGTALPHAADVSKLDESRLW